MTLEIFLNNSNQFKVPKLPEGTANSITELYENLIKNNLPKEETIKKWNYLLLDYIKQEDAIFFIRRYASAPNKRWDLIRRGFLTEYASGLRYVFCDNYFAHYFYLMALYEFTPTLEEFNDFIKSRKFPYGFMKTSAEEPFQAFPKGKAVNINSSGWKLAHLYSVNQNDYNFDYKKRSKQLFPIGNQNDWKIYNGNNFPSRYIDEINTKELRKITIAHFLRLVHPINYFLVPKTNLSNIDIGESPEVIAYLRKMTYERFDNMFIEYEEIIMSKIIELEKDNSFDFCLQYSHNYKSLPLIKEQKKNSLKRTTVKKTVTTNSNIDLSVIKAYLIDGLSFRSIEKEILNIDSQARGGGFVAKKIVNSYGILAQNKGTVTNNNITILIANNSGQLKNTLIKLNDYLKTVTNNY
jgi:hypothetical protein